MQEIASGVFIETAYDGVNVGAILTDDGVVCIDVPSYPRDARDWVSRVSHLHGRGICYLILTDYNGDRIINTRWLNGPIVSSQITSDRLSAYERRYPQQMIDSLAQRNPLLGRELANGPVEHTAISFAGAMSMYVGGSTFTLLERPGPTAGNLWVSWPDSGILFTGDSVVTGIQPPLSEMLIFEWLESLETLSAENDNVKLIVPGRGEPCWPGAVTPLLSFLKYMASEVSQHIASGGSRQDLAGRVPDFVDYLPSHPLAPEWSVRQISLGLQRTYDEIVAVSDVPVVEN